MAPRRSTVLLQFLLALVLCAIAAAGHSKAGRASAARDLALQAALVSRLELTDLCLSTEARYTRHPSQSDLFAPFQDHPRAIEHFPSGSILAPPR